MAKIGVLSAQGPSPQHAGHEASLSQSVFAHPAAIWRW